MLDLGGSGRQDVHVGGAVHDAGDLLDLPFGGPVERVEGLERGLGLGRGRDDLLGQVDRPSASRAEDVGRRAGNAAARAVVVYDLDLVGGVGPELVDGHDRRLAEMRGAVEVGGQVFESSFDGRRVGVFQGIELDAAVHLECPNRGHQHDRRGVEAAPRGT